MRSIKDQVAIVGMGCSKFGENWDKSADDMIIDAAYEAFADAGIEPKDIQAAVLGTVFSGITPAVLAEPLQLDYIPITRVEANCATGLDALRVACFAVACGMYDLVLALGVEKLKDTGVGALTYPYGLHPLFTIGSNPGVYAMAAQRYFHKYNIDPQEGRLTIAKIAVKNHHNGSLHPASS